MKLTALLLVYFWDAQAHTLPSTGRTASLHRSPATVHFGADRSLVGPQLLHVDAFNQFHSLRLQPISAPFADTFRLQATTRNEQGDLIFEDVFCDEDHDVSVLYEDPEAGGVVKVSGTRVEGILSPTLTLKVGANGQHEAVRQETQPEHHIKDYLEVPLEDRHYHQSSATSRAVASATVEMYIIVDSTLVAKLGDDTKVKNYLGVFWNAVNLRFATFTDPSIKLILAGALIVRKASDEPYITTNIVSGNYINGDKTLALLSSWLFQKNASLPAYDVAYLMTGKDMVTVADSKIESGLAGIAWMSAACTVSGSTVYKAAMGEDNIYYMGVMTAAHEIAHNLGAPHDGSSGADACSWDLGYIMSYVTGKSNKLLFSSCSKSAMKNYILSSGAGCLKSNTTGSKIPLSATLPGQLLSLEKQCQIATGKASAYPSKTVSADSLCVQLVCQWQENDGTSIWTYTQSTGRPAAEGSPCKTGGACRNGACK